MKCLQILINHTSSTLHPIHEFEIQHDSFHGSELLQWNPSVGDTNALIFRVYGDPGTYRELLDNREQTLSYSIALVNEGIFYCIVYEDLTERDRHYVAAFADTPVVIIPPVRYNQDRTIEVTLVGSQAALDSVIDGLPDDITIEILSITNYQSRVPGTVGVLTDRQRSAVEEAIECGYYESPRQGTVSEVADQLEVSKSTAAEHLRKAEAKIMREMVGQR